MSNFDPFADIVVPAFTSEYEGTDTEEAPFTANLSTAVEGIRAALQSTPKGRDTTAASKLAGLIEEMRRIGL